MEHPPAGSEHDPRSMSYAKPRELKVEDALLYLDQVKMEFSDKPHIYNEFLEIMKNFKAQSINTPGVIERVKNLFRGYNKLILGFNTFLPEGEGYKIELTAEEQAQGLEHQRMLQEAESARLMSSGRIGPSPHSVHGSSSSHMAGAQGIQGGIMGGGAKGPEGNMGIGMGMTGGPSHAGHMGSADGGPGMGGHLGMGQIGVSSSSHQGMSQMGGAAVPGGSTVGGGYKPPQQMQQQHAISYVTTIRNRFVNEPETYRSFLKILHTYQKEQKGIKDVLEQVSTLFADHPDLLMEFTYFLPDAVQEQAKERLHRAARESELRRRANMLAMQQGQQHPGMKPGMGGMPNMGPGGAKGPSNAAGKKRPFEDQKPGGPNFTGVPSFGAGAGLPGSGPAGSGPPGQQKQKQRKKTKDGQPVPAGSAFPGDKPSQQKLPLSFNNQPTFSNHTHPGPPTFSGVPLTSSSKEGGKGGAGGKGDGKGGDGGKEKGDKKKDGDKEGGKDKKDGKKEVKDKNAAANLQREHTGMVSMMKDMGASMPSSSAIAAGANGSTFAHHISVTAERKFFDQVKDLLTSVSRDSWNEFVRCLDLFSCDAITKKDMLSLAQDLFGPTNSELFDDFKGLLATRADYEAHASDMWYATPLSEIDFTQCRKCTPSYRALPKSYPKLLCTDRSAEETAALNDIWVSIPIGSEESFSFKHMRKNQYEEALFKCEDDRFEIDMIIDSNMCTIRVLEPIAEEIANLRALEESEASAPRFSFQLDKRSLGTIHLNCITRLYGDHGQEILELLRKNPAGAIPVVLKRLKQKDVEWRKARQELNRQWKEVVSKNYERSFDHRSFYFKQQDKRSVSQKHLLMDIKTNVLEPGYTLEELKASGVTFGMPADKLPLLTGVNGQLSMAYSSEHQSIHRDVYRLLCHAAESQLSSQSDKERLAAVWRDFLRVFFNIPTHFLYTSTAATNATETAADFIPVDPAESWPESTRVLTVYGSGTILGFRASDSMYKVQLPYGVGYLAPFAILGAEELSPQALFAIGVTPAEGTPSPTTTSSDSSPVPGVGGAGEVASVSLSDKIFGVALKSESNTPTVNDPCKLFYGTQMCYLFLRMHHTIFARLCEAKNLSDQMREQQEKADKTLASNAMDVVAGDDEKEASFEGVTTEKRRLSVYTSKPAYQSFLGQLYGVIDGSVDANRYEESCRQLLGNRSFVLLTLDKVVQHAVKCLQAMANDDNVNKLIGLFVYHRCRGVVAATAPAAAAAGDTSSAATVPGSAPISATVDPVLYHNHVAHILGHTMEDVYRLQLVLPTGENHEHVADESSVSEFQHVVCQCLGSLNTSGASTTADSVAKTPALSMPDADGDADDDEDMGNESIMHTGDNGDDGTIPLSQSPHSIVHTSPRSLFVPIAGLKIEPRPMTTSPVPPDNSVIMDVVVDSVADSVKIEKQDSEATGSTSMDVDAEPTGTIDTAVTASSIV